MAAGDYSRVISDALAQVEAGAHMLDVNAGIPMADEPAILAKAIKLVQSITVDCRSRSIPPSSPRWKAGWPPTRASRWSTPSRAKMSGWKRCCR
jgi:hypothetical protein